MAFAKVIMENPTTGSIKTVPVGFAWTVLFFGFWPAVFRADWKWAGIMFGLTIVTLGMALFVFMFIYNRLSIKDLIADGYQAKAVTKGSMEAVSAYVGMPVPELVAAG